MGQYWTNFAKTGDPNSAGLTPWPPYAPGTDQWMTFNPSIEVKAGVRAEKLDIMERVMVARIEAAVPQITPLPEESDGLLGSGGQEIAADSLEP